MIIVFSKLNPAEDWGPIDDLFELMPHDPEKAKADKSARRAEYRVQK